MRTYGERSVINMFFTTAISRSLDKKLHKGKKDLCEHNLDCIKGIHLMYTYRSWNRLEWLWKCSDHQKNYIFLKIE